VLRLTGTERAVAEIVAVAEHVASLTTAAAAFHLAPDVPEATHRDAALVPPVDAGSAGEVSPTLSEIAEWSAQILRISHVPVIWRVMAHQPRLLETTWRKDRPSRSFVRARTASRITLTRSARHIISMIGRSSRSPAP
jgi:hypothetical protein